MKETVVLSFLTAHPRVAMSEGSQGLGPLLSMFLLMLAVWPRGRDTKPFKALSIFFVLCQAHNIICDSGGYNPYI